MQNMLVSPSKLFDNVHSILGGFFVCLFVFVQGLNYLELETVKGLFGSISYWQNLSL